MRAFLLGAAVLTLAGACGSESTDPDSPVDPIEPTDPTDPPTPDESARDRDELATILAAHVRAEAPVQLLAASISENVYPAGFALTAQNGLEYTGTGVLGSLNFNFVYYCNDGLAAHTVVPCDGLAHHSHFKLTLDGSQTMGEIAMDEIDRVVDWEIRDLTADKARFRGPDALTLRTAVTTEGEVASYFVQFTAQYEQVRFLPGEAVPTYGTIDFTVNTERTRGDDLRVFNSTARLVFGAADLGATLDIDGVMYMIDVASGTAIRL